MTPRAPGMARLGHDVHGLVAARAGCGLRRRFEAVEFVTLEWIDWFNHRRLLEPIGNIPSAEAEERYDTMLGEPAMAA